MDAAVLIPLYRDADGEVHVVLLRRSEHGRHGGQLAFPGGIREPADASAQATALREAEEEIGLPPSAVEILEPMPELVTRTTGFRITPFLARIVPPPAWRPDPKEVAEVIDVRISDLLHPDAYGESVEQFPSWPEPVTIAFYHVGSHRLWGATYRILAPLLPRIVAGEWPL